MHSASRMLVRCLTPHVATRLVPWRAVFFPRHFCQASGAPLRRPLRAARRPPSACVAFRGLSSATNGEAAVRLALENALRQSRYARADPLLTESLFDLALDLANSDESVTPALRAELLSNYGVFMAREQDRFDEAHDALTEAAELIGELGIATSSHSAAEVKTAAQVHWNLARFAQRVHADFALAERQYQAALRLLPDDAHLACDAAHMFIERGSGRSDYETAEQRLKANLERHPKHATTLGWLAFLDENVHRNYTRAAERYESALALDPSNTTCLRNYGLFLLDKQQAPAAAKRVFDRLGSRPVD